MVVQKLLIDQLNLIFRVFCLEVTVIFWFFYGLHVCQKSLAFSNKWHLLGKLNPIVPLRVRVSILLLNLYRI